jgi:LacI family transcriptional regulator
MKFDPAMVSPYMTADGKDWKQSYAAMRKLLSRGHPDGVFCYNDPIAIAAIDVALEAGIRIPQDIAFIGCDNLHFDASLNAPLSSVDHHSRLIGVRAAKMLLNRLKGKASGNPRHVALQPALVVRASSLRRPSGQ